MQNAEVLGVSLGKIISFQNYRRLHAHFYYFQIVSQNLSKTFSAVQHQTPKLYEIFSTRWLRIMKLLNRLFCVHLIKVASVSVHSLGCVAWLDSRNSVSADDILNVSKLNMGLLSITLAPFDLGEKVKEVLRMFEM